MKRDHKLLTENISGVIEDMPLKRVNELLNGGDMQDLVKYCIEKYDNEFESNVVALGSHGADEIAWSEVMGVFQWDDHESKDNWAEDLHYHENLSDTADDISVFYMRLARDNEDHKDYDLWRQKMADWMGYKNDLKDLVILSEDDAKLEVARLNDEYHAVKELLKNSKEIPKVNWKPESRIAYFDFIRITVTKIKIDSVMN